MFIDTDATVNCLKKATWEEIKCPNKTNAKRISLHIINLKYWEYVNLV